jgi:hypothetical protein
LKSHPEDPLTFIRQHQPAQPSTQTHPKSSNKKKTLEELRYERQQREKEERERRKSLSSSIYSSKSHRYQPY